MGLTCYEFFYLAITHSYPRVFDKDFDITYSTIIVQIMKCLHLATENILKNMYLFTLLFLISIGGTKFINASKISDDSNIRSDQTKSKAQIMTTDTSRSLWKTSSENKL